MPEDLGNCIVHQIPTEPQAYLAWLVAERAKCAEWDEAVKATLRVERPATDDCENEDGSQSTIFSPWQNNGPGTSCFPSYLPEFNDLFIEWVYVVDLDREVFTVDHAVHLKLDKIPRHGWINTLGAGAVGERILLPCFVPKESITDLVLRPDPPAAESLRVYMDLDAKTVRAKGIKDFDPSLRHGAILYARIFQIYQRQQKSVLSHLLLGWEPSELHFREMAYAILCLASLGSGNVEWVDSRGLGKGEEGHAFLRKGVDAEATTEFIAHLGVGSHLEENAPGSAPQELMYWFQGALVLVTAQLDRPGALEESVAQAASYCRAKCPEDSVNVIVISIEHVVLVRVYADERVEHTTTLSLFELQNHYSKDTRERYDAQAIEEKENAAKAILARHEVEGRRRERRRMRQQGVEVGEESDDSLSRDEHVQLESGYHPESIFNNVDMADCRQFERDMVATEPTFMALVSLLDATARQRLPQSKGVEGRFPLEIYRFVIANIVDFETHCVCKRVSRNFRDLCQETLRVGNNAVTVMPNPDTRSYSHAPEPTTDDMETNWPRRQRMQNDELQSEHPLFRVVHDSTGLFQELPLGSATRGGRRNVDDEATWHIVVGSEHDRRSMICGLEVAFRRPGLRW